MKTSMGLWDALFGEKFTFDLPLPDGKTKKVTVTKKWWKEMIKQGMVKDVTATHVTVNIIDPGPHISPGCTDPDEMMDALMADVPLVTVEYWRIGIEVPQQQYDKFLDPDSKELYAMRQREEGENNTFLVQKILWDQARKAMGDV